VGGGGGSGGFYEANNNDFINPDWWQNHIEAWFPNRLLKQLFVIRHREIPGLRFWKSFIRTHRYYGNGTYCCNPYNTEVPPSGFSSGIHNLP